MRRKRIREKKSAAVFDFSLLPASGRSRFESMGAGAITIDNLYPAQQALARAKSICAIRKDGRTIILSPTGDIVSAIRAIREA